MKRNSFRLDRNLAAPFCPNDQGDRAATDNANQTAGPKRRFGPPYCSGSAPIFCSCSCSAKRCSCSSSTNSRYSACDSPTPSPAAIDHEHDDEVPTSPWRRETTRPGTGLRAGKRPADHDRRSVRSSKGPLDYEHEHRRKRLSTSTTNSGSAPIFELVLVLVLVLDQLTVLGLRFAHAVALHRHPSQHRDDPLEFPTSPWRRETPRPGTGLRAGKRRADHDRRSVRSSKGPLDYEHEHRRKRLSTSTAASG